MQRHTASQALTAAGVTTTVEVARLDLTARSRPTLTTVLKEGITSLLNNRGRPASP
ncbi:hypothetical protein ACFOWZ_44030 [Lentzea rhizosphaerae]|uniref:Uncharacterized protein n=1 Tax=Lentzea rhizosphaerae TaxID=2041025 RepID=A0ABV8C9P2_9PSEU